MLHRCLISVAFCSTGMLNATDFGRPVRKSTSLHSRKSTPNPKFLGTAEAYFSATWAHTWVYLWSWTEVTSIFGTPNFVWYLELNIWLVTSLDITSSNFGHSISIHLISTINLVHSFISQSMQQYLIEVVGSDPLNFRPQCHASHVGKTLLAEQR